MKQLKKKLLESEQRYRLLFDKTPNAILILAGNVIVDCNPKAEKLFKRTKQDLIGLTPIELSPKYQRDGQLSEDRCKCILEISKIDNQQYDWTCVDSEGNQIETEIFLTKIEINEEQFLLGIIHDVTLTKQTEKELRLAKEFVDDLIQHANTMILMLDQESRAIIFNKAAEEITGYTFDEVKNKKILEILVPKNKYPEIWEQFENLMSNGVLYEFENPILTKSGEEKYILWRNTLIKVLEKIIGVLSFGIDITERKRAEEDYIKLFKSAPIAIFITQGDGFTLANPAFGKFMGYTPEEIVAGVKISESIYKDDLEFVLDRYQRRLDGEDVPTNYQFRTQDAHGNIKWVEITSSLIEWKGKPATLNFTIDVTAKKETELKLQKTLDGIIHALSLVVDTRDSYTAGHQTRVSELAKALAEAKGLSDHDIEGITLAASIHDIGKLGVPSELLSKPTALNSIEFELIKTHCIDGYDILKNIDFPWPIAEIVYQHHEKLDGSGYPRGLKGDEIILGAQIISVADVVEAIASHRPYRPALGIEIALNELRKHKGTKYNTELVDLCVDLFNKKDFEFSEAKYNE